MNLVPILSAKPEVSVACARCHQPVRRRDALADIDREPSRVLAYYCRPCTQELSVKTLN